jgi:glycosyltransferase involved in cell wall biosynthesis
VNGERRPLLDLHHLGHRQTGNESWARSLAAALFELDGPGSYDIAVTSAADSQDLARLPARQTVTVGSGSARRLAWDLPRAMRKLGTTVALVQYTAPLSRVPAVVAVHDLSFEDPRAAEWLPLRTRLRYRATIRTSVRRAAHVLAISEFTRRDLIRLYGVAPERVTVVHAAVDPALAALIASTPEQRCERATVLTVGNVLPRKNLVVLAKAVRVLRDRGADVVLRVVGSVPPAGEAEARDMRRELGDALETTGYVTPAQLAIQYRSAHVLAFPSLFEGFGIPVIEAMAADLPVAFSDRTSLPEVAGSAGIAVPVDDAAVWAEALMSAMDSSTVDRLVRTGRAQALHFDWATSAAAVSRILAAVGVV